MEVLSQLRPDNRLVQQQQNLANPSKKQNWLSRSWYGNNNALVPSYNEYRKFKPQNKNLWDFAKGGWTYGRWQPTKWLFNLDSRLTTDEWNDINLTAQQWLAKYPGKTLMDWRNWHKNVQFRYKKLRQPNFMERMLVGPKMQGWLPPPVKAII